MPDYASCVISALKEAGITGDRAEEIISRYRGFVAEAVRNGDTPFNAELRARKRMREDAAQRVKEQTREAVWTAQFIGSYNERIDAFDAVRTSVLAGDRGGGSPGGKIARAASSLIESDRRLPGLPSYVTKMEANRGLLYATFGDEMEKLGKGRLGRQKGKAHLPHIISEIFDESSGDAAAAAFAASYRRTNALWIERMGLAGGRIANLKDYRLPQSQSVVKMVKAGKDQWILDHMKWMDWERMRWPDGSPIAAEDRAEALSHAFDTLSTMGASKIDRSSGKQKGGGVIGATSAEEKRFLKYKDAESWRSAHSRYGEGNEFDAIVQHIDQMAHQLSLLEMFGPDPRRALRIVHGISLKRAADHGGENVGTAEAAMRTRLDPMFETMSRAYQTDPDSNLGNLVVGLGHMMVAAQLGSALMIAAAGDFAQTIYRRAVNRMPAVRGFKSYLDTAILSPTQSRTIARQSGFVLDDVLSSIYGTQRYSGYNTWGSRVTKHLSDVVMRTSLMSAHTHAARWSARMELMGLLAQDRSKPLEQLAYKAVVRRYGITDADWDLLRSHAPLWDVPDRAGVQILRPLEILQADAAELTSEVKERLFQKWSSFVIGEAKTMVPETSIEGTVMLKGTTTPDTMHGTLLHTAGMYKSFPITLWQTQMQETMMRAGTLKPLGYVAALGVTLMLSGMVAIQLSELAKGRHPMPMDNPAFWGKAALKGGALAVWGDFMFAGVNQQGQGPEQLIAGPLGAFFADTTQLAFGDLFKFAESLGGLGNKELDYSTKEKLVEYTRRYAPGTSLWWARTALRRAVFDQIAIMMDPSAKAKMERRERKRERTYGNKSWWNPGSPMPNF